MPPIARGSKTLPPVFPNAGIEAAYRRKLLALIEEMHNSVRHWVLQAYRKNPPEMALDGMALDESVSAVTMRRILRKLARRWYSKIDAAAPKLAAYYAKDVSRRSDLALRKILLDAGFAVEFKMTRSFRDVFEATVAENVALIKSIPRRYLPQVEGDVMRSIAAGRDLAALSKTLQRNYASTKNRAALISLDQNNKATAAVTRTRRIDLGLYDAVWMHSHAGKEPRPTHVAMDNRKFDIRKGMYDPDANGKGKGEWVQPGYLISCRCVSRPIVKGFG